MSDGSEAGVTRTSIEDACAAELCDHDGSFAGALWCLYTRAAERAAGSDDPGPIGYAEGLGVAYTLMRLWGDRALAASLTDGQGETGANDGADASAGVTS